MRHSLLSADCETVISRLEMWLDCPVVGVYIPLLLMTDCDTLNCLVTFSWILPSCSTDCDTLICLATFSWILPFCSRDCDVLDSCLDTFSWVLSFCSTHCDTLKCLATFSWMLPSCSTHCDTLKCLATFSWILPFCSTHCDTLKCLATFSWMLPFCSNPMALHLSFSVKHCMTAFEGWNSFNVGLRMSCSLKQKSCEHCSNRLSRGWQLTAVVSVIETLWADPWPFCAEVSSIWLTEYCLVWG